MTGDYRIVPVHFIGGWSEVKKNPLKGNERIKSDERILGDSDFILQALSEADEELDRTYRLRSQGYDITGIEKRVIEIFGIEKDELYLGSRKQKISEARNVFCYWCVRKLGESMTSMANRLGTTQPVVGYAVDIGKKIVKTNDIQLVEKVS